MAQYEQTNQLDYRQGGDTVDDFARKYMAETTRIFRFLNDLRSNTTNSVEVTEPVAGQLKFEDGKLYCRNQANTAWVLLGTPGSVAQIDANGVIDGSITGNAGKLAGYNVATDNVQDGQVLTYRAATQTWTNENKGVIGTGKALNLYDGSTLLATYNGDTEATYDLGITANAAYCRGLVDGKASVVQLNTHNSSKDSHSNGLMHPLVAWAINTAYVVGDVTVNNKRIYQCKTAHTSGATFDKSKWENISGGGAAIGDIKAIAYTGNVEDGWLLCDGASLLRTMYPDLFSVIGTTYGAVDDTHFNLPNLIDRFIEGSDESGEIKQAGLPNITGQAYIMGGTDNSNYNTAKANFNSTCKGAFSTSNADGQTNLGSIAQYAPKAGLRFDASLSNSIYGNSDTVQPPAITMRYIIRAFDDVSVDPALLDITAMAQEISRKMDLEQDFAIIYPNGGTAESPANVAVNSRYVLDNPFPNYAVHCVAEVKYNNQWAAAGFAQTYNSGWQSHGVTANQLADNIVVQTGINYVFVGGKVTGNAFGGDSTNVATSLPCRVKVWKVGKIV